MTESPMIRAIKRAHLEYMIAIAAIAEEFIPLDELEKSAQQPARLVEDARKPRKDS